MASRASAQRLRIGTELRRLRLLAGVSGEQVAQTLGWSQPKVSRIELGTTSFTVRDVAGLLAIYGAAEDVRAELLAATAEDTGESAWIIRAGGYPRRQGSIASMESVTSRIRHFQPVVMSGLLQTREYARAVISRTGTKDVEAAVEARMKRQDLLLGPSGPRYEMVMDARALLIGVVAVDVVRDQINSLAERAESISRLDFRIIPFGTIVPVLATVGFTVYDFKDDDSPSVAWVESPTGDVYFSAEDDIAHYSSLFDGFQGSALPPTDSIRYLRSLAVDIDRYLGPMVAGGETA